MAIEKNKIKTLDRLFDNFFQVARGSFQSLEGQYGISGVVEQIFGKGVNEEEAKLHLRESAAWQTLVALYEYAVNGVDPDPRYDGPSSLVIDASDVLKLANSENYYVSEEWENIVAMGDGRYGLDDGHPIALYKVSLLANVNVRTVQNAVSAGELIAFKNNIDGILHVENASARAWLYGRRAFKPTVMKTAEVAMQLSAVDTPASFAAFLTEQRKRIGLDSADEKLMFFHPEASTEAIAKVESGIFMLPLSAVFPLADFYRLSRKDFLDCVMRVFFSEELEMLSESAETEVG